MPNPPEKSVEISTPIAQEKAPTKMEEQPAKRVSGSALVKARCGGCHPMSTVYGTKRTPSDWRSTVARMLSMGAQLTPEERAVVLRHLVARAGL